MYKINPVREKILLLLFTGVALGFSYSPHRQYKIFKSFGRAWRKINENKLKQEIRNLYKSHLIESKENPDGSFTYALTNKGKLRVLTYQLQSMKIKKFKWDGKYRFVIFDIPEQLKKIRESFRSKLKELGFRELQKSVWVIPHECKNEVDFLVEFFNLRKYARYGILEFIDNDLHLRKIFKLSKG